MCPLHKKGADAKAGTDDKAAAPAKKEYKGFKVYADAVKRGEELWNDKSLGEAGLSCKSSGCHARFARLNFQNNQTYPHLVGSTGKVMTLTQMINHCLENPMAGKALDAASDEMTAMASYFRYYRMQYRNYKRRNR